MSDSFGQWVPAIAGAVLGLLLTAFAVISTRRLDAHVKKAPEPAEDSPGRQGGTPRA